MMNILDPNQRVYLPSPVNREHPYNLGTLSWWQVMPGWDAGPVWQNLWVQNPGALTSFSTTVNPWQATTRQGGSGQLLFSGAGTNYVLPKATTSSAKFTVACWVKLTTTPATRFGIYGSSGAQGLNIFNNGGSIVVQWRDNTNGSMNGSKVLTAGTWYWIVFTYDGTTANIYINGNLDTSAAKSSYNLSLGQFIGSNAVSGGNPLDGALDEVILASRAWSGTEVGARFQISSQGNSGVLNRVYPAHGIKGYSFVTFAVALDSVACAGSVTAAVPPPSSATLNAIVGPLTFASVVTAAVPFPSFGSLHAIVGDVTFAGVVDSEPAPPSHATLNVVLDSATFTSTFTATLTADIRNALETHLLASPIAGLVDNRIYPLIIPQTNKTLPALTYTVVGDLPGTNLSGADGTSVARIQLSFHSKVYADCSQGIRGISALFSGKTLTLGGTVTVTAIIADPAVDHWDAPIDGTSQGTYMVSQDFKFHYRLLME